MLHCRVIRENDNSCGILRFYHIVFVIKYMFDLFSTQARKNARLKRFSTISCRITKEYRKGPVANHAIHHNPACHSPSLV
jgi:hypothetical protein